MAVLDTHALPTLVSCFVMERPSGALLRVEAFLGCGRFVEQESGNT